MPSLIVQIERTPNPEAVRILPGIPLASGATIELQAGDTTAGVPIATALLAIDGVTSLLIGRDFVTVVRASPDISWDTLKPKLLLAVADFLLSGEPAVAVSRQPEMVNDFGHEEVAVHIQEVIDRFVRPMLARDGGEATLIRFDGSEGIAYIRMGGACGGCPSGKITLERSIEQTIKRYVPEVARVEEAGGAKVIEVDPRARFRAWIATRFPRG